MDKNDNKYRFVMASSDVQNEGPNLFTVSSQMVPRFTARLAVEYIEHPDYLIFLDIAVDELEWIDAAPNDIDSVVEDIADHFSAWSGMGLSLAVGDSIPRDDYYEHARHAGRLPTIH